MKKLKYIIVSPTSGSGGAIALHALCKCLNDLGEKATMFYPDSFHMNLRNDIFSQCYSATKKIVKKLLGKVSKKARRRYPVSGPIPCPTTYFPRINKNTIVVYPEIIHGNILGAKNVVRWLLWHNRTYKTENGKCIGYDKNDLFFCYREVFNDYELNPECRKLHVASFDFETYKRYNFGERKGKCYIIRKGSFRSDLPREFDGPIIDALSEKEKVKFFNECEYCISYDTQTTYSQIASLCGCVSVIIPEPKKTRADYRHEEPYYGVAFGLSAEEIKFASETQGRVQEQFETIIADSLSETQTFIDECEAYFALR